jgi:hypothetical protein
VPPRHFEEEPERFHDGSMGLVRYQGTYGVQPEGSGPIRGGSEGIQGIDPGEELEFDGVIVYL